MATTPTPTPAAPTLKAPAPAQQLSIDDFANKLKKRYPKLAKFDNFKLTHGAIQRQPRLQRFLSTQALQEITEKTAGPDHPQDYGFTPSNIASNVGQAAKAGGQFLMDVFNPTKPLFGSQGLWKKYITDPKDQEIAKTEEALHRGGIGGYTEALGHGLASDIPLIGPAAASIGEQIGRKDIGGASAQLLTAYLTGKAGAKLGEMAKATPDVLEKFPGVSTAAKRSALEDAYVNMKGAKVAQDFEKASKSVNKEIETHAKVVAAHADASGTKISVNPSLKDLDTVFADVVRTPDRFPPALQDIARDLEASKQTPRTWDFDQARQFRSKIGKALSKSSGPMKAALAKTYKSLTDNMDAVAKQQGPEVYKSWNKVNELTRKYHQQFGDLIDDVTSGEGTQNVATKLLKDKGLSQETIKNLQKYGLNGDDVRQYMKDAQRIISSRTKFGKSIFRLVYGTGPGATAMIGSRMLGAPWIAAMGISVPVALASMYFKTMARALKLDPEIVEQMAKERELPGPSQAPAVPSAPGPGIPGQAGPSLVQGGPHTGGGASSLLSGQGPFVPGVQGGSPQPPQMSQLPGGMPQLPSAPRALPEGVTRAPEGESERTGPRGGIGKAGRRTQDRLRQAKVREETARTRVKENEDLQNHVISRKIPMSLDVPTMEESLREVNPSGLSGLKKLLKAKKIDDSEYQEGLKFLLLNHYDIPGELE